MVGTMLRQYRVTSHLGKGGMGEVWKARDTILDRDVALKLLPSDGVDQAVRKERFFREARAASALNHPNIITIYEINSDQGVDFIAMEHVRGRTLAAILRDGPLTIEQAVRYALQIAEAVGRAHSAGIVHRDLKPGNIMLTDDDDLVKVLDFGLAKLVQVASNESELPSELATQMVLTQAGSTSGTAGYMSPEQAIGDVTDARSDVFSFGVILYEMFTRTLPFAAKNRLDGLRELHFGNPAPLESLRSDAPPAIVAIVSRTLAKRPTERFANLTQVATALRLALSGHSNPTAPAAPSTLGFDRPSIPRAPMSQRATLIAVSIVVIAGAMGTVVWRFRAPVPPMATADPSPQLNQSAGVSELTHEAARLMGRQDKEGNVESAIALLDRALTQDKNFALAYAYLSSAYLRKHQTKNDEQWLKLARDNARQAVGLNADLAAARQALAFVHLEAGERTDAEAEFRRVADLDPANAMPYVGLGLTFAAQGRDADADAAFRKAIELGPQEWRPRGEYGQFFFRRAAYADAAAQWEIAQKLTPDNVLVLRNLGAAYYLLDRPDEAASILQRALEVGPSASIYTNLGTIRFFQGRYTDAVAAFEKAVELAANNQNYWGNLGDGLRWAPGRRGDAPAAYRQASQLIQEQISKKPVDPDLRSRHALYLIKMGDRPAALKEIQGISSQPKLTAQMLYRLTIVYELAGDRTRALSALERALKAGYVVKDLSAEPELIAMRTDARYHRMVGSIADATRPR